MEVGMQDIKYGNHIVREPLDNEGSLYTRIRKINEREQYTPIEETYEIRRKVKSPITEAITIAELIKELESSPSIVEAGYRVEGYKHRLERGYYYVVMTITTKVFESKKLSN